MIKVLEEAIEKVKKLPEDRQAYAAEVLEQIVSDAQEGIFEIPDEHMEGVLEGLEQAKRGEFATEREMQVLWNKWAA
jgi:predicted transcriptional regulator